MFSWCISNYFSRYQSRRRSITLLSNLFVSFRPLRSYSTQKNFKWLSLKKEIQSLTDKKKYNEACASFQRIGKKVGNVPAPYLWAEIGRTLTLMKKDKVFPTVDAFNTLIDMTGVSTNDFEEVVKVLDSMDTLKVKPDTNTFNSLIYAMIEHNKFQFGSRILYKMKASNVSLNLDTLNLLINAYANRGEHDILVSLLNVMTKINVKPNDLTGMIIQKYYGNNENHRCAVTFKNLLKDMKVKLTSPLPKLEDDFDHYYSHFPKPKFDDKGSPIIPKEFLKYKDYHTPNEDGTFPWEMQGSEKDIKIKPWRDPPIKSVDDFTKWANDIEKKEKKVVTMDLMALFDFVSLRKEIDEKYNLKKMKEELETLNTEGQAHKYWLNAFAGLGEDLKKDIGEDSYNEFLKQFFPMEDPIPETDKDPFSDIINTLKKQNNNPDIKLDNNSKIETEHDPWNELLQHLQKKNNANIELKENPNLDTESVQQEEDIQFDDGPQFGPLKEFYNSYKKKHIDAQSQKNNNNIKENTTSLKEVEEYFGKRIYDHGTDTSDIFDYMIEKDKNLTPEEKKKLKEDLKTHTQQAHEKEMDKDTTEAIKNIWLYGKPTKPTKPIPEEYGWEVPKSSWSSEKEKKEWLIKEEERIKQEREKDDRELDQFLRQNDVP